MRYVKKRVDLLYLIYLEVAYKDEDKHKLLIQENSTIRKGLKEMNEYLSQFIDHVKDQKLIKIHSMGYKYGNNGKLKQNREQKLEKLAAESENYKRMIRNLTDEHAKYKSRVDLVTDTKYVLALRQDVSDTKDYISQLQK